MHVLCCAGGHSPILTFSQSLKVEYNSLAPLYASCVESGQSLVEVCEEGGARVELEGSVVDLQDKWERLRQLFGDLNEKLTAALVQVSTAYHHTHIEGVGNLGTPRKFKGTGFC